MASIGFIYHGNHPVFYTNLSGARSEEIVRICQKSRQVVQSQPQNSVFSLVNVERLRFNAGILQEVRETLRANRPFIQACALFGLEGLNQSIIQTLTVFAGREVKVFADLGQARQWLHEKARLV